MSEITKSRIFLYFCLAIICGIAFKSFLKVSQVLVPGFLILGLILISVFWKYKRIAVFGLGFIFSSVGIIFNSLGWFLFLPCWLLLTYLLKIVDFFSKLWTLKSLEISWIWLAIAYFILSIITWRLQEKQKLRFLQY